MDVLVAAIVPVREAAYIACRAVAAGDEAVSNRRPGLRSQFPTPTRESVLEKVGFARPVTAPLRLVPTKAGLQLAWEVRVTHEKQDATFHVRGWEGADPETVEAGVGDVFTRRGMGPDASSPSAGFDGIVEGGGG